MRDTAGLFRSWVVITFLAVIAVVYSYNYIDRPLSMWLALKQHDTWLHITGLAVQNVFTLKVWSVISIVMVIYLFWRNPSLTGFVEKPASQFCLSMLVAMFMSGILKVICGRYRPDMWFTQHLYGFHFFSTQHDLNSMPSNHTVVIFVMVSFFALRRHFWKEGFPLLLVGAFVAFMRITFLMHYLSDVIAGAYVGYTGALIVYFWCNAIIQRNYVR